MKVYRLTVTYETVVRASSEHAAECAANRLIRDSDDEPLESDAVEIAAISELPMGWDGKCRPWGERDPYDRTLEQILGQNETSPSVGATE